MPSLKTHLNPCGLPQVPLPRLKAHPLPQINLALVQPHATLKLNLLTTSQPFDVPQQRFRVKMPPCLDVQQHSLIGWWYPQEMPPSAIQAWRSVMSLPLSVSQAWRFLMSLPPSVSQVPLSVSQGPLSVAVSVSTVVPLAG